MSAGRALAVLAIRSGQILRVEIADGACSTITAAAGPSPDGLVVLDGDLYWTTMGAPIIDPEVRGERGRDFSRRNGGVHRLVAGSTEPVDLVSAGHVTTGKQLAYDGAGTLYWSDREGAKVSRVGIDGAGLEDVLVNDPADGELSACVGVAVDHPAGHFYWTQKGPSKGGRGRIFRAGIDLPAGASPAARPDIEVLWDALPEPIDLEIVGGWLYWTDRGAAPAGNTLNRAALPRPGERGVQPEILADGFREAIGLAVDEPGGAAYVSDLSGDVFEVTLNEGVASNDRKRLIAKLGEPAAGLTLLS